MIENTINVYISIVNSFIKNFVTENIYDMTDEELSVHINHISDSISEDNIVNDESFIIIITDKVNLIKKFSNNKSRNCIIVYCGRYNTIVPVIHLIDNIWHIDRTTSSSEIKTLFSWEVDKIKSKIEAEFDLVTYSYDIISNVPSPIAIFSEDWRVIKANKLFTNIVEAEELDDFDYSQWKYSYLQPMGEQYIVNNTTFQDFCRLNSYYCISESAVYDELGGIVYYICTVTDTTYQHTYATAANTDVLTGMFNRRYFNAYMNENIKQPFYLMYIDLDHFKSINDNYGHDAGDAVLVRMAQLIDNFFPDGVNARLGGDEFGVICETNASKLDIKNRCDVFERTVRKEFKMYECNVGVSIGIVYNDGTASGIDKLLHDSDEKMYQIKKKHHESDK